MRFFQIFIFVAFSFTASLSFAQTIGRFEPELTWEKEFNENLYSELTTGGRFLYIKENQFDFDPNFLLLSGMLNYQFKNNEVGAGFIFRFYNLFDDDRPMETRIVQRFVNKQSLGKISWKNQILLEEIFAGQNSFRPRFLSGISLPIGKEKEGKKRPSIVFSEELLWEMSSKSKSEFDQRMRLEYHQPMKNFMSAYLGLQFRTEDFTADSQHFFIITLGFDFLLKN